MVEINKIGTGMDRLDGFLNGGFPENSVVVAVGSFGSGKTIMSMQYIWEGLKKGQKCLYISMEEPVDALRFDAEIMGWDFESNENNGDLEIMYLSPDRPSINFMDEITSKVRDSGFDRIVVDPVSVMLDEQGDRRSKKRKNMYNFYKILKKSGATSLLTAETKEERHFSRQGIVEYICDGVMNLYYQGITERSFRDIEIRKMRNTNYIPGAHPYEITGEGIKLRPEFRDKDFMERYKSGKGEDKDNFKSDKE